MIAEPKMTKNDFRYYLISTPPYELTSKGECWLQCVIILFPNLSLRNFPSLIKRLRTVLGMILLLAPFKYYHFVSLQLFDVSHYWILLWLLALIHIMAANHATSWCSIISEDLLYTITEDDEASPELRVIIQNTLNAGQDLFKKSAISNNINWIIDSKSTSVTFNSNLPPATGFECYLWSAKGQDDLPGEVYFKPLLEHNLECVYSFFLHAYSWRLFNNDRNQLHMTHNYGWECLNVYWNSSQVILELGTQASLVTKNTMWPQPCVTINFSRCWDVLTHELTHGIISQTSGLHYCGESGALSEHLADVFRVLYKQYAEGIQTYRVNVWMISEVFYSRIGSHNYNLKFYSWVTNYSFKFPNHTLESERPPSSERYSIVPAERPDAIYLKHQKMHSVTPFLCTLTNPSLTNLLQAIHYPCPPQKLVMLLNDKGGVHHYSDIPSLVFYTAAMDSGGEPWWGVGQVWFYIMVDSRLCSDSNFPHFAALTIDVAEKQCPELKNAIIKGWKTVEVEPLLLAESE